MSLVSGWTKKLIGEVCKTGAGGTPLKSFKEYYEGGEIPWLLSGEVAQGEIFKSENFITQKGLENSSAKMFPVNTVLVAMYGATAGQVGILRFEAATNQAVCGILPNDRFIPEYIYYALLSKKAELISKAAGNAQPNISQIKIRNTEIPVPTLLEQKRIVSIVDEAFEAIDIAIDNTKQNLINARELFDSYLNAIFTQKGEGWIEKKLEEVCLNITDGKHGDCNNEDNSGYFFLSAKDIKQDRLNYEGARQITKEDFEENHRRTRLEPDDILITNSGTIGRTAVVMDDDKTYRTTFQKSVAILKPIKEKINSEFCRYSLIAHLNEIVAISSGTAQKNLLLRDIRSHRFYMPISIHDQKIIAARINDICQETQRLEAIYRQKLTALNELKQSILHKAFTGELTADTADLKTNIKPEAICT
mgnify:CR=1 FL=1